MLQSQCPSCEQWAADVVREIIIHEYGGGEPIEYEEVSSRCRHCGDEFLTVEQSMQTSRNRTLAIQTARGWLIAQEIREAREEVGMTQAEFERALGLGKKTVARWERGTVVQGAAANVCLWLAAHHPQIFREYALSHSTASAPPTS